MLIESEKESRAIKRKEGRKSERDRGRKHYVRGENKSKKRPKRVL